MKKTVILLSMLCSVYSLNMKAQTNINTTKMGNADVQANSGCTNPFDKDNFSAVGSWTSVDPVTGNGSIHVTGGAINFSNTECSTNLGACNGREIRLYRSLTSTLSNNTWRAECKFRITDGNGPAHTLMGFTAGHNEPEVTRSGCPTWVCGGSNNSCGASTATNQDGIFASIICFGNNQLPSAYNDQTFNATTQTYDATHPSAATNPANLGWRIFGHAKNNAGPFYQTAIAASNTTAPPVDYSRGIELPALNTDYYLRLERLSVGSCMISVFSDVAMTQHVVGSPQCFYIETDIVGLNTMQNFTHQSGSFFRSLSGTVDDFVIYDQCPNIPVLSASPYNNASVCVGNGTTITATPGFTSYTFVGGTTNVTTTSNSIWVSPPSTTVYTVYATYPGVTCPLATTVTVTVIANPYINFNPDFTLTGTSPAGNNTYFTASATPIAGSTNYDIAIHGGNYGYLWKIEQVNSSGVSTVVANNPSNWWVNLPPFFLQNNNFCGFNGSSVNTGAGYSCTGTFNLSMKYRITRGVWNPCYYTEKAKIIYFCTNCKSEDGKPVMIVEDDVEYNNKPHFNERANPFIAGGVENSISIYPNPNNGNFVIETAVNEDQTVEVFDVNGKMVLSQGINGNATINAGDLPDGIYNVKIVGNNNVTNKRIIIAR